MKTFNIKAQKRTELGKKSTKKLRAEDQVPCVMYGGKENVQFFAHENEFRKLVYTDQVYLVVIEVDFTTHNAVMKEIQFHPVTDKILHIDFIEVIDGKPAIVELPILLEGTSVGILAGGKLRLKKRYLRVKGLVADLPELLKVDITNLNIGSVIKVSDLSYDNLELLDPAQAMVVGVVTSRLAKTEEEEAEEAAAEAEEAAAAEGGDEATEAAAE